MRLLALSDLHLKNHIDIEKFINKLKPLLVKYSPDTILITGDIFESFFDVNPYQKLAEIFGDLTVICTLGNHEFLRYTVDRVMDFYTDKYEPEKYNVHYLDVVNSYKVEDINFFGNVLWYDGSMATVPNQNLKSFADDNWADRHIRNFDFLKEHMKCRNKILDSQNKDYSCNILCTHCVPHWKLNGHMHKITNPFNAFSGVKDFIECVEADWSFCGHTHIRIVGEVLSGTNCVNIGNDYEGKLEHFFEEI